MRHSVNSLRHILEARNRLTAAPLGWSSPLPRRSYHATEPDSAQTLIAFVSTRRLGASAVHSFSAFRSPRLSGPASSLKKNNSPLPPFRIGRITVTEMKRIFWPNFSLILDNLAPPDRAAFPGRNRSPC